MELVPDSIGIFHKSKWIRWKWDGSQLGDWDNLICKKKKKIHFFYGWQSEPPAQICAPPAQICAPPAHIDLLLKNYDFSSHFSFAYK